MSLFSKTHSTRLTTSFNSRRASRRHARSGVVLLLVVTLLVMFLLIGITGVIVSSAFYSSSKAGAGQTRAEVRNEDFMDRVVMQLLRGPDQRSALWGHDLLGDLYGIDSYLGTIQSAALDPQTTTAGPNSVSPLLKLTVTITNRFDFQTPNSERFFEPDFFAGRLFSVFAADGSLVEPTVRILRSDVMDLSQLHDGTIPANQLQYMIIIDNERNAHRNLVGNTGFRFMISGLPFSGTGAGYKLGPNYSATGVPLGSDPMLVPNDTDPNFTMNQKVPFDIDQDVDPLTTPDLQIHTLLLPNYSAYALSHPNNGGPLNSNMIQNLAPYLGGADEAWDGPDLQNMWLARMDQLTGVMIPSFYRAKQVEFLRDHVFTQPTFDDPNIDSAASPFVTTPIANLTVPQRQAFRNVLRAAILRPLPGQHPAFHGGNQDAFAFDISDTSVDARTPEEILSNMADPRYYCDVDTDGDLIKDAIWIDPGLPVQTTREGRRYKVLAAIKVEDLNARVNLNSAMNEALAYQNYQPMQSPNSPMGPTNYLAGGAASANSGRGSGWGGAEVTIPLPTGANYGNLQELIGIPQSMVPIGGATGLPGRYGPDTFPGGSVGADLLLTMRGAQFVSPEQLFGVRQIALDRDGQPLFHAAVNAAPPRAPLASPYRMNPLWTMDPNDRPFRNTELESQLRAFDADATIMDERIQHFVRSFSGSDPFWAKNVTSLSSHLPIAGQLPQKEWRSTVDAYRVSGINPLQPGAGFAGFMSSAYDQLYIANAANVVTAKRTPIPSTLTPIEQKHLALVLVEQGGMLPGTPAQWALARARARADFKSMLPFELRHGHAMDVNRPFGNGSDDATNWGGIGPGPGAPWLRPADGRVDNNILIQRTPASGIYDAVAEDYNPRLPNPPNPGASRTNDPEGHFAYGDSTVQATMSAANVGYDANSHFLNDLPDLTLAAAHIRTTGPTVNSLSFSTDPRQYYARHLYVSAFLSLRTDPATGNKFLFGYDDMTLGFNATEQRELLMRRLAQWAVNVADYRDPDSVMTCFEFDLYPENGWDCDGDPRTIEPAPAGSPFAGDPLGERRVVWGCERPELLLTESLAFHDRCVADSMTALPLRGTAAAADQELDQVRFPQASLFLEFYCPRPRALGDASVQPGDFPTDMYSAGPALDLSRMAPAAPDGTRRRPAWRVVISESVNVNGAIVTGKDPAKLVPEDYFDPTITALTDRNRHLVTYQPEAMIGIANGTGGSATPENENLEIEREIWFSPVDLTAATALNEFGISSEVRKRRIFTNRTATTSVQPGKYLVIGPRLTTQIGQGSSQQITFAPTTPPAPQVSVQVYTSDQPNHPYAWGGPNASFDPMATMPEINNHPSNGKSAMYNGPNVAEQNLQAPSFMICASLLPDTWTTPTAFDLGNGQQGVGINISTKIADSSDPYWDVANEPDQVNDTYSAPRDLPFDNEATSLLAEDGIVSSDPMNPRKSTGTQEKYKVAFLQRLADPNLPYNPMPPPAGSMVMEDPDHTHRPELPVNPYITVDSMSLDLTVFNGSEAPHEPIGGQEWDTGDQYVDQNADGYDPNTPDDDQWRITTAPEIKFATREKGGLDTVTGTALLWTPGTTPPATTVDKTNPGMPEYGEEIDPNAHFDFNLKHSLGYLNESLGGLTRTGALTGPNVFYNGSPSAPFHWLTWANGPYSSAYEVIMVPASSPSRLLHEMGDIINVPGGPPRDNFYAQQVTPDPVTNAAQFPYLMNFFRSENTGSTTANAPDMSRLLELLSTPNQFVGSDRWYRPASMPEPQANIGNTAVATIEATMDRRPPFNYSPQFREPGRVNLNTSLNLGTTLQPPGPSYVWENAIAANFPEHQLRSQRISATMVGTFGATSPEMLNNPLRPADASELLPNYSSFPPTPTNAAPGANLPAPYTSAMAGLLRQDVASQNSIFANQNTVQLPTSAAHPGFRYQGISRLANTTTNQANAFAVWITIGKFEVNYVGPSQALPDGYTLGTELGFDNGTQVRHRSFFIIDRTAPVTYEAGKNHNSANCILLRRFLE
jgi:hypothetical protein